MIDYIDLQRCLEIIKSALGAMKDGRDLLPRGPNRDAIDAKIRDAEAILARSDAELAKELGLRLCDGSFPQQIMLWQERRRAWVCPNVDCSHSVLIGVTLARRLSSRSTYIG